MTHEIYAPRPVSVLDTWALPGLSVKVYGLQAGERPITDVMQTTARAFVHDTVLPCMERLGDSNGLGFVILHPGTLELSISANWWTQGSVLCQRFYRQLYGEDNPLDMDARPSIGCVWELGIIAEETRIWRGTMMGECPDTHAYLTCFGDLGRV